MAQCKYGKAQIEWIYTSIDPMNNSSLSAQVYLFICIPRISLQNVNSEEDGPFFDAISEKLFPDIPDSASAIAKVFLNIEQFEIGQSYVTAKIVNKFGDKVGLNIQGGKPGIELQESLFRLQGKEFQDMSLFLRGSKIAQICWCGNYLYWVSRIGS